MTGNGTSDIVAGVALQTAVEHLKTIPKQPDGSPTGEALEAAKRFKSGDPLVIDKNAALFPDHSPGPNLHPTSGVIGEDPIPQGTYDSTVYILGGLASSANSLPVTSPVKATLMSGTGLLTSRKPQEADAKFQNALAVEPKNVTALTGHMLAARGMGDAEETLRTARRIQELEPQNKAAAATIKEVEKVQAASHVVDRFRKLSDGLLHGPQDDADLKAAQTALGNAAGRANANAGPGAATKAAPEPTAGLNAGTVDLAAVQGGGAPTIRGLSQTHYQFAPLVLKALNKQSVGDFTGALLDLTQELDQNEKDLPAWILRAEVDNALKNFPAAVHDAGKALELAPENARALRARAYAELQSGDDSRAFADAAKAVSLDPTNGLGFLYMAMAEQKMGRPADAVRDLRKAVELDPSLEPLARPLASALGIGGPPSSAKRPLVRGGSIAVSLALVLFGLLGTRRGREITRSITSRPGAAEDAGPPEELAPGAVLAGSYEIVRELGRGGMGVVYEGRDRTLDRRVAIKRLIQDAATTPDDVARFLREARLVAALKHPNLAQIFNVLPGREPFLVFEFVDGKPLDQVLREARALPLADARRIIREVAGALGAAHAAAIIHRDLKPGNVMIGADGAAKVMDFGIAHQSHAAATRLTQTLACGTPPYMPPEQVMGSVSKASDLYALGVMAYELVTGARPFDGPDFLEQKIQRRYAPATTRVPSLPAGLDAFFAQALEPDPTKRHADAAAFAAAFERACDATPRAPAARA